MVKGKKTISILISVLVVLLLAFMFDVGLLKYGLIGLIVLTIVISGYRLYTGWDQYKLVVDMGAEQLRLLLNNKKKR